MTKVTEPFREKNQRLGNTQVIEQALGALVGNYALVPPVPDILQLGDQHQHFLFTDSAIAT